MRIVFLFIVTLLFGNEKLFIAKFQNLKNYYYQNQLVDLKLKIITAKEGNLSIFDENNRSYDIVKEGDFYKTDLIFVVKNRFPKFKIIFKDGNFSDSLLLTINSEIKKLYPPQNFSNIIATDLKIEDKLLTNYNHNYNIVYWTIIAQNGEAKRFKIGCKDEKLYFLDKNSSYSKYSYSALVPIDKKRFEFTYFDLDEEKYKKLSFSIKLKTETISTQIDIKPMDKNRLILIDIFLGILLLLWIILYFYRKKKVYIFLILFTIGGLIFYNLPKKEIILSPNSKVHILPFKNSTIFFVTKSKMSVKVLKERNGWLKIEINNKIGWVKENE